MFDDLKGWVNKLFARKEPWSYEEQSLLAGLMPISKEARALLSWAYTLPRDAKGWALVNGTAASKPKQSVLMLLREFSSEIDKWRSVRGNGAKKKGVIELLSYEWVAALKKIYGADIPIPQSKHLLAPSVQQEIEAAVTASKNAA